MWKVMNLLHLIWVNLLKSILSYNSIREMWFYKWICRRKKIPVMQINYFELCLFWSTTVHHIHRFAHSCLKQLVTSSFKGLFLKRYKAYESYKGNSYVGRIEHGRIVGISYEKYKNPLQEFVLEDQSMVLHMLPFISFKNKGIFSSGRKNKRETST